MVKTQRKKKTCETETDREKKGDFVLERCVCQSWGSDERDIPWSISLISRGVSGLGGLAGHSIPAQFTHPHTCTQLTSERRREGDTNAYAVTHLEKAARVYQRNGN